jgi:hypothetical protein
MTRAIGAQRGDPPPRGAQGTPGPWGLISLIDEGNPLRGVRPPPAVSSRCRLAERHLKGFSPSDADALARHSARQFGTRQPPR